MNAVRALGRFAKREAARRAGPRCELCSAPIAEPHPHVVELAAHAIRCACRPCALLFAHPSAHSPYRTIPDRILHDPRFGPSDSAWAALGVPVELAFFFKSTTSGTWTAFFPSPAGATEADIDDSAWATIAREPLVRAVEPDIEALLVRQPRQRSACAFLVPIDRCYELVAIVRRTWRGFAGGDEAQRAIDAFFAALAERSRPIEVGMGAP